MYLTHTTILKKHFKKIKNNENFFFNLNVNTLQELQSCGLLFLLHSPLAYHHHI